MGISRRAARECALKALYSYDFNREEEPELFFARMCEEGEVPCDDFAKGLFLGTLEKIAALDEKIAENAKGWKFSRIARMSLAIMRLAAYEMLFAGTPKAIAINEAVELAKAYDTDDAPAFINGVLNALAPAEENA